MNQRKCPNLRRPLALLLVVALCLTLAAPALAAQDTAASSIQLAKTEGTVSATNSAGRNISLIKNLRLFSGYHVLTEAKSYAWLNLDSTKLLKEDASSETEVRKNGKKLEVLLSSGSLFFNVTEPLDDDETMNIRTSTTLTGVRGTCGWVEVIDRWNTQVCILEGTVECVVSDPVSGESKSTTISAGDTAIFTVYPDEASAPEGERCEIVKERCAVEDIPGYVLVELVEDRPLCGEIRDASGLDILGDLSRNGSPAAEARRRLAEEEEADASRLAAIAVQEEIQANNVKSAPNTPVNWEWDYDPDTRTLYIEGIGEMDDFTASGGPWYAQHGQEIESAVISTGITHIGNYAFSQCSNLTSVTIPDSVTSIGGHAFQFCSSLADVTIPDSVTSIGSRAFQFCSSLTSVTIPSGVTSIEGYAFENCSNLMDVNIPDSVTRIGNSAFDYCPALTDVYYDGSETQWRAISIGTGNSPLTGANIHYASSPDDLNMVGNWGWRYDEDTKTLYIGGSGAIDDFANRSDAPWYEYREQMESVVISGGITRIGNNAFAYCSNLTSVSIPNSVTSIGDYTFYDCHSLTSVTIPAGVTSIGSAAFDYCYNLTSVSIPDSVTSIGDYAFYDCHSLTSVTIPGSVTSIEDYTFTECTGLTSVTIQNGVTGIGVRAFQGCTSLTGVTIPDSVTTIRYDAFYGCYGLLEVRYGGDAVQWSVISIESGNTLLTDATIHYNSR